MTAKKLTKISIPWLSKKVDCTPEGRKLCQGKCCTGGYYHENELWRVPEGLRHMLVKKDDGRYGTQPYPPPNGRCPLYDICMNNAIVKPQFCWLYPIVINKNGTMILSSWVVRNCPNYGKGEEAWISLKDNIIEALGQDTYDWIEGVMTKKKRPLTGVFQ